jgi:hypothetical protein
MTTSVLPLSNDARLQEAVARARHEAEPTVDGALVDREAFRREVRAAIEWFKRMREASKPTRSTSNAHVERAPEGDDPVKDVSHTRVEAAVAEAPAMEAPPPASGKGNAGEQRTTAIEPAKASPEGGVLDWLKRTWSRLTSGVWNNPLAACLAPIAAYLVLGGLVCMT